LDQVPFFDAFLSYASKDRNLVTDLAQRLHEDGLTVFFDVWFIAPGHHVRKSLLGALEKSRRVVACMTPAYFESEWADFELNWHFVDTHLREGSAARLIPVLLRACTIPAQTSAIHRIDMTGARREAAYPTLRNTLSQADSFAIEGRTVEHRASSQYLGDFVAGKLNLLLSLPEARIHNFVTVYGELIQNAFDHRAKKDNRVEVTVRADRAAVVLEVSDSGSGFNLQERVSTARGAISTDPAAGVRGLYLVSEICDRLDNEIRNRRHVVTAVLRREKIVKEVATLSALAPLDPADDGKTQGGEHSGPWFLRFFDPAGRYACLAIKVRRIAAENVDDLSRFFNESLRDRSFARIVVECSDVQYIASVGLRALMMLAKGARAKGGTCALVVREPVVMEILEISRFNLIFEICASLSAALDPTPLDKAQRRLPRRPKA
jgi:anti-anti-sigma factor